MCPFVLWGGKNMNLKEGIRIKGLDISNRLYMPPMATGKGNSDGSVSDTLIEHYVSRGEGGYIGLMATEYANVSKQGKAYKEQVSVAEDYDEEGLKRLVKAVHEAGSTKFLCQIVHAGAATSSEITGMPIVGPSAILKPNSRYKEVPKELSVDEIHQITADFAAAAKRVKEVGFDMVEIHGAHGYLLNQFYSPITNKRHDDYGCECVENRMRFMLEVVDAVRASVGEEYPIAVRLGGCDYAEGGSTIEDAVEACQLLEAHGVDLIDLTGGVVSGYMRSDSKEPGWFADMSTAVMAKVRVPVILTGGVTKVEEADTLLAMGAADMIGVGRALFGDPKWAEKNMQ